MDFFLRGYIIIWAHVFQTVSNQRKCSVKYPAQYNIMLGKFVFGSGDAPIMYKSEAIKLGYK